MSFGCSPNYSNFWENLKYVAQAVYMVPTALLYTRILYVIWGKYKSVYSQHQFFVIYSIDSVVGLLLLLLDIFITRLFVYLPQLCLPASRFFLSHPILMDLYYPLLNYLHCAQPLIQIFLTTNRMTALLFPMDHNTLWKQNILLVLICIVFTPFLFIWNTIISKKILIYYFGGFYINYTKLVPWAGMSLFLMVLRSLAVAVTVVSTSVTFWKMTQMKKRLKKSERMMCVACAANSMCFMVPAVFEALKAFSPSWSDNWVAYLIQPFAWDVLNVGSPIVMISVSGQLRSHVFSISPRNKKMVDRNNSIAVSLSGITSHRSSMN